MTSSPSFWWGPNSTTTTKTTTPCSPFRQKPADTWAGAWWCSTRGRKAARHFLKGHMSHCKKSVIADELEALLQLFHVRHVHSALCIVGTPKTAIRTKHYTKGQLFCNQLLYNQFIYWSDFDFRLFIIILHQTKHQIKGLMTSSLERFESTGHFSVEHGGTPGASYGLKGTPVILKKEEFTPKSETLFRSRLCSSTDPGSSQAELQH